MSEEVWPKLAKAKAEQVVEILEAGNYADANFSIHDARWCIKLLAEAIIAILPEESE
jgi:hypothetical protein